MNKMNPKTLTANQKMHALSYKYYEGGVWIPKTGDYYTLSRADLELYEIVYADENIIKTKYCDPAKGDSVSEWPANTFLTGFGEKRIVVPKYVFSMP